MNDNYNYKIEYRMFDVLFLDSYHFHHHQQNEIILI